MSYQAYLNNANNMYRNVASSVASETARVRGQAEEALGALREKQKDLEGYKEKVDNLTDTVSGAVTGIGAAGAAGGAAVAKAGKGLVGAAKIIRKGIARSAGGEAGEAEEEIGEVEEREDVASSFAKLRSMYSVQADSIMPGTSSVGADAEVAGIGADEALFGANVVGDEVAAAGTAAAETIAGGLETAGLALDASGIGVVAGIAVGAVGGIIALAGLGGDVTGDIMGGVNTAKEKAEGIADDARQAMISTVTQNAPTAGSFVIPSMNGASLAHLPSSMSHA